jgi:hypothetical protein
VEINIVLQGQTRLEGNPIIYYIYINGPRTLHRQGLHMHQHLTAARAKCMYSQSNKQIKKHILEKKETENPLTAHLWLSSPPSTSNKQPFVSFPPSHEGDHLLIKDHLLSYSSVYVIVLCGVHRHVTSATAWC